MAILHPLNLPSGIILTEAYARIQGLQIMNDPNQTTVINIAWFASQEARAANLDIVRTDVEVGSGITSISAAYDFLKTLEKYSDALDA